MKVNVDVGMVEPSNKKKKKKILITGGGRGLGFAIAKKCVAEGAEVLICGRSSQTLEKAASELGDCLYSVFDVTDYEHIPSFVHGTLEDGLVSLSTMLEYPCMREASTM